jgi:hypothetical protein
VTFVVAWIIYPLALIALCGGCGLLLRRLAAGAVPGVLLLPAGFALAMVVVVLMTYLDATAELATWLVVALALIGYAWSWPERGAVPGLRAWIAPGVAAAVPFAAMAAPIVLTGRAGFTGYARIVDLAAQLDLTAQLSTRGRAAVTADSSFHEVVAKTLAVGYPGGGQATLGATTRLVGLDPIWGWQPFMAFMAAMLGLGLYRVLQTAIPHRGWRAGAAAVAAQGSILYAYALTSGIKELATVALIVLAAALLTAYRPGDPGPLRQGLPLAITVAAGLAAFNVGIAPWIGMLALVAVVAGLKARPVRTVLAWAAVGVAAAVLAGPSVVAAFRLAPVAISGGPGDLGNLAAPVPVFSAAGVWLTTDYRFPLDDVGTYGLTAALAVFVAILAAVGLVRTLLRRDVALLALGIAGAVALPYVVWRAAPWAELKAFAITAPIALALAFAGVAALGRGRWPSRLAPVLGLAVAGAVLAGNALAYSGTTIAPSQRLAELEDIGNRYAGEGPALHPSFDEYAEYLLRDERATSPVNPPAGQFGLLPGVPDGTFFGPEPDQFDTDFLKRFPLLVLRRNPTASRPPSWFSLVQRTRYYEVWRRTGDPNAVVAHIPLDATADSRDASTCRAVVRAAREGSRIAYVEGEGAQQFGADPNNIPGRWEAQGADLLARGPGRVSIGIRAEAAGRHSIWVRATLGRRVRVQLDGRDIGALRWRENYPLQFEPVADVQLSAGDHRIDLIRGGGTPLPGTANDFANTGTLGTLGPVAILPDAPAPRVQIADASTAGELCGSDRKLDWIEVLR